MTTHKMTAPELKAYAYRLADDAQVKELDRFLPKDWHVDEVDSVSGSTKCAIWLRHKTGTVLAIMPSGKIKRLKAGQRRLSFKWKELS